MGDVIQVNFGAERDWEMVRKEVRFGIDLVIQNALPERSSRIDPITDEIVSLMRKLETPKPLAITTSFRVPPGCTEAAANVIANTVVKQAADQFLAEMNRVRLAGYSGINVAVTRALMSIAPED